MVLFTIIQLKSFEPLCSNWWCLCPYFSIQHLYSQTPKKSGDLSFGLWTWKSFCRYVMMITMFPLYNVNARWHDQFLFGWCDGMEKFRNLPSLPLVHAHFVQASIQGSNKKYFTKILEYFSFLFSLKIYLFPVLKVIATCIILQNIIIHRVDSIFLVVLLLLKPS